MVPTVCPSAKTAIFAPAPRGVEPDEAVQFFRIYSKDEAPGAVTPEAVLPRLQKTGDDAFPYYLPQIKRLAILTIKMEDLL